jgi:hypothetical protein
MVTGNSGGNVGHAIKRRCVRLRNGRVEATRLVVDDCGNPPQPPIEHAAVAEELVTFIRSHGAQERSVHIACGLLDKTYLCSLALPRGARGSEQVGAARGNELQYLFRRHIATLLGWDDRHPEGAANGFPDSLNHALRENVYPGSDESDLLSDAVTRPSAVAVVGEGTPTRLKQKYVRKEIGA